MKQLAMYLRGLTIGCASGFILHAFGAMDFPTAVTWAVAYAVGYSAGCDNKEAM